MTDGQPALVAAVWRPTAFAGQLLVLAALAMAALALAPGPTPALAAAALLVVFGLVLGEPVPDAVGVRVRPSDVRCSEGEVVSYQVMVTAPAPLGTVHLEVVPGYAVEAAGPQRWLLDADGTQRLALRPTGWRVGSPARLQLGLSSRLGGWAATVDLALPELVVHPTALTVTGAYGPPQLLSHLGLHVGRARGSGTEFAELRRYHTGDDVREVNWRASARSGALMVSQRYRDQAVDVVLLVDHLSERGRYDRQLADAAVRGGAAVLRAHLAVGDRVGLVLFGSVTRWIAPATGEAQRQRLLDQLVTSPAVESYVDPELRRIPAAALPARALVFCFTPLLDERMLAALGALIKRGHRLVVVDLAGDEPASWPAGLAAATPQVWRRHRELLSIRLAEAGAMVVDDVRSVPAAVRAMARRGVA